MIKKEIYPKTKRIKNAGDKVYITEKLDGSNMCIFKKEGIVYIAQIESQTIPNFIATVPKVTELNVLPNKEHLDSIYKKYCEQVNRNVEGFVINYKNIISKYVRMKNGKVIEYDESSHKGE